VEWLQAALDELAEIWMHADPAARREITTAAHILDQELSDDPFRQSESRDDGVRVMFVYPLAVLIEVDPQRGIVWIIHVWRFRRRGS
jgi:hypothetical protein